MKKFTEIEKLREWSMLLLEINQIYQTEQSKADSRKDSKAAHTKNKGL